jgi:tetratricopeptide (TPR) repeat protein
LQISEQTLSEVQELRQEFAARQGSQAQVISTILDQSRPRVEHWLGRDAEMSAIQAQFGQVNLIGITGLGGYGKSALAAKLFDATNYDAKIWITLSQPYRFSDLGRGLLAELGVRVVEQAEDETVATVLVNQLAKTKALVVLDNLETLLTSEQEWQDPAYKVFLVKWLEYGSNSLILITSRERPDLPANNSYWHSTLQGLEPEQAVRLLGKLGIRGTDAELKAFVHRVDGHPLLLNLAAGLLKEELGNTPDIIDLKSLAPNLFEVDGLHKGDIDNNVKKLFDASLAGLEPDWKQLLLNLSVYRLPFNHEAAESQLPEEREIQITEKDLRQLARRSLLQELEQRDRHGKRQFTFQPLLLAYVQQVAEDLTEAHQGAVNYYKANLTKPETWQAETDLSEYFEAIHHYCKLGYFALAYDVLVLCHDFLNLQGYYKRLIILYSRLVPEWVPSSPIEYFKFGHACTDLGIVARHIGNFQLSLTLHGIHIIISREIGDKHGEATALGNLSSTYNFIREHEKAIEFSKQALKIQKYINDRKGEARSMGCLGNSYFLLGQPQSAIDYHRHHLSISSEISDKYGEATALGNLGNVYSKIGEYDLAISHLEQALKIDREIGNKLGEAKNLNYLGRSYRSLKEYRSAIDSLQQCLVIRQEIENKYDEEITLEQLASIYQEIRDYEHAVIFYTKGLEIARKIGNKIGEGNILHHLGLIHLLLEDYKSAIKFFQSSLTIQQFTGDRQGEAMSLIGLGNTYYFLNMCEQGLEVFSQALVISREIGDKRTEANSLSGLGAIYDQLENYKKSIELLQEAINIWNEIGDQHHEAILKFNLGVTLGKLK